MSPAKSPGAMAALGASGIERLGRQVVSKNSLPQTIPQAPIGSNLSSHSCEADCAHADDVGCGP